MIAVIFELQPKPGLTQCYFDLADALRASLMSQDGFLSIERFESVSQPGRYLSLSFWRDEAAVSAWRNMPEHRDAQCKGRTACVWPWSFVTTACRIGLRRPLIPWMH